MPCDKRNTESIFLFSIGANEPLCQKAYAERLIVTVNGNVLDAEIYAPLPASLVSNALNVPITDAPGEMYSSAILDSALAPDLVEFAKVSILSACNARQPGLKTDFML